LLLATAGCEHELARFLAGRSDVFIHRLTGLFSQLKPNGTPYLFLANARSVNRISVRSNVLDLEGDEITASQLAVDGQIEQRQIAGSFLDLELGPDRPNMFLP